MTSKHRAPQPPNPGEYFATPDWCVRAILPHLPIGGSVLEPCAGDGAIVRALLASGVSPECIDAMEIDERRARVLATTGVDMIQIDALSAEADYMWQLPHALVIMNPPFSGAMDFVKEAIGAQAPHRGTTAALLRLSFLEGQCRADFHALHPSDVYVLPKRPSFTGDGKSDSSAYAWFCWGPGRGGRWQVLEVCE